jgi:hypothetical protein
MGPAGICTTLYPPDPQAGWGFDFSISVSLNITFMSIFIFLYNYSNSWHIATIKYYIHIGFFVLVVNILWILYFGMSYKSRVYTHGCHLWYSDGTCSVQEGYSPHPGHAPPARRAVLPGVLCEHMCLCLSYITVHCWVWECGYIEV